jgi:hypothetical protein
MPSGEMAGKCTSPAYVIRRCAAVLFGVSGLEPEPDSMPSDARRAGEVALDVDSCEVRVATTP